MKRIFSLILAALLLAGTITGCGDTAEETTAAAVETQPVETESETLFMEDNLPEDLDFGGTAVNTFGWEEVAIIEFFAEEMNGDVVNDAVFQRNQVVEERLNVSLGYTLAPGNNANHQAWAGTVMSSTMAGDGANDIIAGYSMAPTILAYNRVLIDLLTLDYIDFAMPWWPSSLIDEAVCGGKLYFCSGDISTNMISMLYCMFYNKTVATNQGLEDFYPLVKNGTWTIEKNYQMAEAAISDLNGDGQMTVDDRFGYITEWDRISLVAYYGTGNLLVDVIDGVPVASQKEVLFDAFQLCHSYCQINGFMLDTFKQFGTAESSRIAGSELFKQGNSLFICNGTRLLPTMGDMEDDYGIVPLPKWSEEQTQYYSMQDGYGISVPLACSTDMERVCVIKEAMAAESLNIVRPAYYENALKNRYVRDETSVEMLDIITNGNVADLGQSPWWDIVRTPWQNTLQQPSPDFASAVAKNMPKCEKAIADLMNLVADLKAQG